MNKYQPTAYCCITCGKIGSDYNHSKETRRKIGLASIGNTNMLGKHHSEETKVRISKVISSRIGPLSPRWEGGKSFEPYCVDWTDEYKDLIKERDGHICLNPNCWRAGTFLTVHHIDYNKKNCNLCNLITICNSCNSRANTDRDWHKSWYKAIIYRRYKGVRNGQTITKF